MGWRKRAGIAALLLLVAAGCRGVTRITPNVGADGPGGVDPSNSSVNPYSMTPDGRYVAFVGPDLYAPNHGSEAIYLRDTLRATTTLASSDVDLAGGGFFGSMQPALSDDGRYLAFVSDASNLVPGDANTVRDVFVRDLRTGAIARANVTSAGAEVGGSVWDPTINAGGSVVAFVSSSSDLVPGDTNGVQDVFVHDFSTGATERVSVASDGTQGNGAAVSRLSLSADGRYVAFTSQATNLAPNDINSFEDAFVHDRVTGETRLVDESAPGQTASIGAFNPSMSRDGRRIAFQTQSPDLVAGDTNGKADVFVRDLVSNTTQRVSLTADGHQIVGWDSGDASISADGKRVAFGTFSPDVVAGDTNGKVDLFVRDLTSGETTRVSIAPNGAQPMAHSQQPRVADGTGPVAFMNADDTLVAGDGNGWPDVFFHSANGDLQIVTRKTTGIPNAAQTQPALDADGSAVAFVSDATNLVRANEAPKAVFVRDEPTKTNEYASMRVAGTAQPRPGATPALSGDGNLVAFTTEDSLDSDAGFFRKVYVRDRAAGTVALASVASNGALADGPSRAPSLSTAGRYVGFLSTATNLVADDTNGFEDAFVRDRVNGTTIRVDIATDGSQANAPVLGARLSGDGGAVVFWTAAANLVPNDTNGAVDVFVRDLVANTTTRVSVDGAGAQADGDSRNATIDGTGDLVAFESDATNLVVGDTNGATDVFVHRLGTGATNLVSRAAGPSNAASTRPSVSVDGARVAFQSLATNLVTGDTNGASDIFVLDLPSGYLQRASEPGSAGQSNGPSVAAAISGDGKKVAYETDATNILSKDVNDVRDVVVTEVKSPPS